jgi:hypothetical protein
VCLSLQNPNLNLKKDLRLCGDGSSVNCGQFSTKIKRAEELTENLCKLIQMEFQSRWDLRDSEEVTNLVKLLQVQFQHQLSNQSINKNRSKVSQFHSECHLLIFYRHQIFLCKDSHEYIFQNMKVSLARTSDNSFFTKRFIKDSYNFSSTHGEIYPE